MLGDYFMIKPNMQKKIIIIDNKNENSTSYDWTKFRHS